MTTYLGPATAGSIRSAERPWQQAGRPSLSADTTTNGVYPYVVYVGAHDPIPVPMTAAGLRALRDSLTALLAAPAPAQPDDFVAEWAHHHRADVYPGDPAAVRPPEPHETRAEPVPLIPAASGSLRRAA